MPVTLLQARQSRLPQAIGKCAGDLPEIAKYLNEAQQRLIESGGETGWWGGWRRVAFPITTTAPYLTLPRQFARAINMGVCTTPIRVKNEFYELLPGSVGFQDITNRNDWCGSLMGYERGTYPTMVDLAATNQLLRVYHTDARDVGARILFSSALDNNSLPIYSQDGLASVNGFYLTFTAPFATSTFIVTNIGQIIKDNTYGDILLYQVDATTGVEVLLSRFGPDEQIPSYRRYFITQLPAGCCTVAGAGTTLSVTAVCKLAFIPATRDTDMLIIGNIPALTEEVQAIRYSEMDVMNAAVLEVKHHKAAIRLLQNELRHWEGDQNVSIVVNRFLGNDLAAHGVGSLI